MDRWVTIFDIDGTFTPGNFYYYKSDGKVAKEFGADDFDAVRELMKYSSVHIITADKKGWDIAEKRFKEEMGWALDLVANKPPKDRWEWIVKTYPNYKICYVADGIYDWYSLKKADFSICPCDSLVHVKKSADYVSDKSGGRRFVADACLKIMERFFNVNCDTIGE